MNSWKVLALGTALFAMSSAYGQGAAPSSSNPAVPSPPASGSTGMDRGAGTGAGAKPGSSTAMANADGGFVRDAAAASKAEIALGTLAQKNAGSAAVKDFGQKMIADHGKAYDELEKVVSGKGVAIPTEPNASQKRTADKLSRLSGPAFDKQFAAVMVEDHRKAVALFRKEASNGRDSDVKALATRQLPTLEDHLTMAQRLQADVRSAK